MTPLIVTYGRANRQVTWDNLSPDIRAETRLVIQQRESILYSGRYPTYILPPEITTIGPTRQWIMENFENPVMLDDDLEFAVRREDDPTKFRNPKPMDIDHLFDEIRWLLDDGYAMVGVAAREGANRNTAQLLCATRQMRLHAINSNLYRGLGIRYDRIPVMEDFDVTLQFLERGFQNVVLNGYVTNQKGSNTAGGCSSYRTLELQEQAARQLAELHPGFVDVVKKSTKTSWGGAQRFDVRVKWKKAYESGLQTKMPTSGTDDSLKTDT